MAAAIKYRTAHRQPSDPVAATVPNLVIAPAVDGEEPIVILKKFWDDTPAQRRRRWKDGTTLIAMQTSTGLRWTRVKWER